MLHARLSKLNHDLAISEGALRLDFCNHCGYRRRILSDNFRPFERATFMLLGGFGLLSTALLLIGQVSFTRFSIIVVRVLAAAVGALVIFRASGVNLCRPLQTIGPQFRPS